MSKILATVLLLILCGCQQAENQQDIGSGVSVITLDDGTRCALFRTGYAGGIDCDWATD